MTDPITTPEALLPCPFCGSPAKLYGTPSEGYLHCANDDCAVQPSTFSKKAGRRSLIAAWNERALSARIAAPVATVKPLEWEHDGRKLRLDDTMHMSKGYDWDAYECLRQEGYGLDCGYIIWPDGFAGKAWNLYGTRDGLYIQGLADEAAAKAAAQADYAARILSTLTIQPAAQVTAEAVAGAYAAAAQAAGCWSENAEADVLKGTPADAQATLARRDAETRAKALREALKRIAALARGASVETNMGQEQAYNAILAMIGGSND